MEEEAVKLMQLELDAESEDYVDIDSGHSSKPGSWHWSEVLEAG